MKRFLCVLLLMPVLSLAVGSMEAPLPVQTFEQAIPSANATNSAADSSKDPASKASQQPASSATSQSPLPIVPGPSVAQDDRVPILQAQLTQMNQNFLQFQQRSEEKILMLSNQVDQLKARLERLSQALVLMNETLQAQQRSKGVAIQSTPVLASTPEPSPANTHAAEPSRSSAKAWFFYWESRIGLLGVLAAMLVVLLIMIGVAFAVFKRSNMPPVKKNVSGHDTSDEYDYMGSAEGRPAKLNLARAYIRMEDYASAKAILDEIMESGSEAQKEAAKEMRAQCPQ